MCESHKFRSRKEGYHESSDYTHRQTRDGDHQPKHRQEELFSFVLNGNECVSESNVFVWCLVCTG